jgi:hypothetical protein
MARGWCRARAIGAPGTGDKSELLGIVRKLSIQVDERRKRSLLERLESIVLEQGLFYEAPLPSLKSGSISIKDCVVSLLPDVPRPKHEDLHEEL